MEWNLGFVTNSIVDLNVFYRGGGYVYPLYVETKKEIEYGNSTSTDFGTDSIISNFKEETMLKVIQHLGERPSNEDMFDYIYATLYSPNYRKRYSEFLKRDFPHIPYPTNTDRFDKMVEKGRMLRNLHLMQGKEKWEAHKKYPCVGEGTGIVEYRRWEGNKVFINDTQYFDNVSADIWNFYIGGYQVADKWLKDRIDQELSLDEIFHYSQILYVIKCTIALMKEIENI